MNEVTKINRTTGDIIWRLGGKNNQFTFINDFPYGFTAQHDARRIPNGNITIFDNGFFHDFPQTRAIEYSLDEVNMTATLVREIISPIGFPSIRTGNIQTLPNGNTLIGWGRSSASSTFMVTEHDDNDDIVFQLTTIQSSGFGYSYRAFKYPWRPELFTSTVSIPQNEFEFTVFPNPTFGTVKIDFEKELPNNSKLQMFNNLGQMVLNRELEDGQLSLILKPGFINPGVYFLNLIVEGNFSSKKLIVVNP